MKSEWGLVRSHIEPVAVLSTLRGAEGILLQVRRGEGVYGDARSSYQALKVRQLRLPVPVTLHRGNLAFKFRILRSQSKVRTMGLKSDF